MPSFKFAHIADLHLDTPFKGLAELDREWSERLQDASLMVWDRVVQACIDHGVAFAVIAGDVFDSDLAGVRAQLRFVGGLERLSKAGIKTLIVHGNHDPDGGRYPAIRRWPEGVHVFSSSIVEQHLITQNGDLLAVVNGISYPTRHVTENLALRFSRSALDAFHVAVLHCNVEQADGHGRYAPCFLADLVAADMDYWALGHVHSRRVLRDAKPTVVYAGNTQGRHPLETGAKGVYIVEVDESRVCNLEFVPVDLWRFATIDLSLSEADSVDSIPSLVAALLEAGRQVLTEADGRGVIVRARLIGRTALHADLNRGAALAQVVRTLRDFSGEMQQDLWWLEVECLTQPPLDLEALAQGEDFTADLLKFARLQSSSPDSIVAQLLKRLTSHPALGDLLDSQDLDSLRTDTQQLFDSATILALDHLEVGA